jgi:hypothetical protein
MAVEALRGLKAVQPKSDPPPPLTAACSALRRRLGRQCGPTRRLPQRHCRGSCSRGHRRPLDKTATCEHDRGPFHVKSSESGQITGIRDDAGDCRGVHGTRQYPLRETMLVRCDSGATLSTNQTRDRAIDSTRNPTGPASWHRGSRLSTVREISGVSFQLAMTRSTASWKLTPR